MQTMDLNVLIDKVLGAMSDLRLSESTILSYKSSAFARIRGFHEDAGIGEYSEHLTDEFIRIQRMRMESGEISGRHFRKLRKAANILTEFSSTGILEWKVDSEPKLPNTDCFRRAYESFITSLEGVVASGTINGIKSSIVSFLLFLEETGHADFANVTLANIRLFVIKSSEKNPRSMGNIIFALRKFWKHLNETGLSCVDAAPALVKPAGPFKKVLPCFSKEEANALLSLIKPDNARGNRDYAILLLALHTGLRSIDIVHLKLRDIDWHKKEVNTQLSQSLNTNFSRKFGGSEPKNTVQ